MTVGELLKELNGVNPDSEVVVATERPQGTWSIETVSVVDEEGYGATVHLHCEKY